MPDEAFEGSPSPNPPPASLPQARQQSQQQQQQQQQSSQQHHPQQTQLEQPWSNAGNPSNNEQGGNIDSHDTKGLATASPSQTLPFPAHPLLPTAGDGSGSNDNVGQPPPEAEADAAITAGSDTIDSDEFEPEDWDDDRASTASASVTSSIYEHTFENGRRFHSYRHGRYPIPNDDQEQNREDMRHAMVMELTNGKLCYSPVGDHPQKILDLGTGTGMWAIEAGDKWPSASVLGVDLSPIQPVWVPPNVNFIIDDFEDEWLNGDGWDLIHLRAMSAVIKDPAQLCRQAYDNLKPGGWMEWQEFHGWMQCDDNTMTASDPAYQIYRVAHDAFARIGFDTHLAMNMGDVLRYAGFTNIQCIAKKVPVGPWARDPRQRLIGWYLYTIINDFLPILTAKPFAALGLNEVERELWKTAAKRALDDRRVHRYWNWYFWFGQKPE